MVRLYHLIDIVMKHISFNNLQQCCQFFVYSYLKSDSSLIELSVKTTLSSVEPCENASKGLCVLCVEEEKRVNDSETSDTKSVREIVQLQRQESQDVESRIFTDEYLAALEQCKMGCLCFLKNNPS